MSRANPLLVAGAAAAAVGVLGVLLGLARGHALTRAAALSSPPPKPLHPIPLEEPPSKRGVLWWPEAQSAKNEQRATAHGGGPRHGLARPHRPPPRVRVPKLGVDDADDAFADSAASGWR